MRTTERIKKLRPLLIKREKLAKELKRRSAAELYTEGTVAKLDNLDTRIERLAIWTIECRWCTYK